MSETLGVRALVLTAEVRVCFPVCFLRRGTARVQTQQTFSSRPLLKKESVNTRALSTVPTNHG